MKNYRIAVIGLFIFVFLFCITKIAEPDIWWWMKTGEYIWTHLKIPTANLFAYTVESKPWVVQGWLATVFFYLVHSLTGPNGLTFLKTLLIILTVALLLRLMLKKKISLPLTILILVFTVLVARHRFIPRPLIFKYPLTVLFIYILNEYFQFGRNRLFLLPILMLVWVNLHGTFFIGYILIGVFIVGEFIKNWAGPQRTINVKIPLLLVILSFCILVSLINPYGLGLHKWMLKLFTRTTLLHTIVNEEFLPPGIADYPFFWLFLILTGISFLLTLKRFDWTGFLMWLPFAYLAVKGVRYIGLFAIVSAPILGQNLNFILEFLNSKFIARFPEWTNSFLTRNMYFVKLSTNVLIVFLMAYLFFFTFSKKREFKWGLGIQKGYYPDGAIEFVEKNQLTGNMYNSDELGGYLIWNWYPRRKVFIFGDNLLCENLRSTIYQEDISDAKDLLDRYSVNYIFKSYQTPPLEKYYILRGDWELVYWDDVALIYVKDNESNKKVIGEYAYHYVDPLNFNLSYAQALVRHNFATFALNELQRNIEQNPGNFKPQLFLGYLYESLNENEKAVSSYLEVKKTKPEAGYIHYQIGLRLGRLYLPKNPHFAIQELLRQGKYLKRNPELEFYLGTAYYLAGNYKSAIERFNYCLKLNPDQPVVYNNLGFLYYDMARYGKAIEMYQKALEISPDFADSYYGLALIYEKLVEKEEAIKNWEKYLTLGKDARWVATAKEHLERLTTQKTKR